MHYQYGTKLISTKAGGIVGSSLWTSQQINERNARCFNAAFVSAQ